MKVVRVPSTDRVLVFDDEDRLLGEINRVIVRGPRAGARVEWEAATPEGSVSRHGRRSEAIAAIAAEGDR
jgi:hypothetical protein